VLLFLYGDFNEPLHKLLFGRYDLRMALKEDQQGRTHTIGFWNGDRETPQRVAVFLEFPEKAVADFRCRDFKGGQDVSFISTVAELEKLEVLARGKDESDQVHSPTGE